jgi:hypothetical protein
MHFDVAFLIFFTEFVSLGFSLFEGIMTMTLINFILGVVTVVLSIAVALMFFARGVQFGPGRNKRFSYALTAQLIGESIIGFGTLVFAVAAHYGWLDNWSEETQSSIRLVMFLATSITTVHLYRTIVRIQDGSHSTNSE